MCDLFCDLIPLAAIWPLYSLLFTVTLQSSPTLDNLLSTGYSSVFLLILPTLLYSIGFLVFASDLPAYAQMKNGEHLFF